MDDEQGTPEGFPPAGSPTTHAWWDNDIVTFAEFLKVFVKGERLGQAMQGLSILCG